MRERLPAFIESEMRLWRQGFLPLPQLYIEWHRAQALKGRAELEELGYKVYAESIVDDGWLDGMKFVQLIVEDRTGKLLKLKWSDSCAWYESFPNHCGWGLFRPTSQFKAA